MIAQWLRVTATLPEDKRSVPSSQAPGTPVPGNPTPSLGSTVTRHTFACDTAHTHTDTHRGNAYELKTND